MASLSRDSSGNSGDDMMFNDMFNDFNLKQRGLLVMEMNKAVDKAMKKQSDMLEVLRTKVDVTRQCIAINKLRQEISQAQPSMIETLISRTLDVQQNTGLVSWISEDSKKDLAVACLAKLRTHLALGRSHEFCTDFEAILVLYMVYLKITMTRGSRLNDRIEDLYQGLMEKADTNQDLVRLVRRVRWACFGVRAICVARSQDTPLLSESEVLELCGCFSAIGAGMPILAREFQVCKQPPMDASPPRHTKLPIKSDSVMSAQLRQAAGDNDDHAALDFIYQFRSNGGINVNATSFSPKLQDPQGNHSSSLPSSFKNDEFSLLGQAQTRASGVSKMNDLDLTSLNLSGLSLNNSILSRSAFNGLNLASYGKNDITAAQAPSLLGLGLSGNTNRSTSHQEQPMFSSGYSDTSSGVWLSPPLPPSSGSPEKKIMQSPFSVSAGNPYINVMQSPLPPRYESPQKRSSCIVRAEESPMKKNSIESSTKELTQPVTSYDVMQVGVPTQTNLALAKSLKYYYDRPTELPKECDRVRKAMFARMLNHLNGLPKATLCSLQPGHDPACPLSHTYMEVMTYNPLYKRLICRQPSHYWGSQIKEDESCVCLHVETGLTWEWMDESHEKRLYCLRGDKCTNVNCIKSHSFEEICWYNPLYKIKRCTVRAHDHISRARGMIAPPLDCSFYHIEEGMNADKRELTVESDYVGKDTKMLFTERTHKPLADLLETLRYVRMTNL